MKLTPEQKDAFARGDAACSVVERGRNQWCIRSPWRDIDGPKTETVASHNYITARMIRGEFAVWEAMKLLGYDEETRQWAIPRMSGGRAIEIYKAALLKAGPVECEGESE